MLRSEVLQVVNEFERIGDHADNICNCAEKLRQGGSVFSEGALTELDCAFSAIEEIIQLAVDGYARRDAALALTIEPLEDVINILVEALKDKHNERLKQGLCSLDSAFPYVEILYNLERIADHCSNIGVHIVSYSGTIGSLDRHEYLREMHRSQTEDYQEKFEMYDKKYFGRLASNGVQG
jgi:phosphate:Na+ symporter